MPANRPPRTDPTRPKHVPPRNPAGRPDPARPTHQPPLGTEDEGERMKDDLSLRSHRAREHHLAARAKAEDKVAPQAEEHDPDSEAPRTAIPPKQP